MKKITSSNKIYVSQSTISGADRGVFANVDIKKDELIENCPFIEIPEHEIERAEESVLINYYYFFGEKKERFLVALGFGSIYNHLYTPNARYHIKPEERVIEFIALKEIKKDEEIIVNYNQGTENAKPLWFEK